jgi:hypothetical protein
LARLIDEFAEAVVSEDLGSLESGLGKSRGKDESVGYA